MPILWDYGLNEQAATHPAISLNQASPIWLEWSIPIAIPNTFADEHRTVSFSGTSFTIEDQLEDESPAAAGSNPLNVFTASSTACEMIFGALINEQWPAATSRTTPLLAIKLRWPASGMALSSVVCKYTHLLC